jgi:Ulp1 family protease
MMEYIQDVVSMLQGIVGRKLSIAVPLSVPQQENGIDCGVFVAYFAKHIFLKKSALVNIPRLTKEKVLRMRMEIAATILSRSFVNFGV